MEAWALSYGDAVQFLCVCVESERVGLMFSTMFDFQKVVNSYIPGRAYLPVGYGQLGCSGFIISDTAGCFVSMKTAAYLLYGERAFEDVEYLLAQELKKTSLLGSSSPESTKDSSSFLNTAKKPSSPKTVLTRIEPPSSVGVACMDSEHEACTVALNALLARPSIPHLKTVVTLLQEHFEHEEALMKAHGFGGTDQNSTFSALTSHTKDHHRILQIGLDFLNVCSSTSGM